jgi:hypothetical protein
LSRAGVAGRRPLDNPMSFNAMAALAITALPTISEDEKRNPKNH